MPLFLWALYATAIIQIIATPVLGVTLLLFDSGTALPDRYFQLVFRRRPDPVPTLLLVLFAPGRVHHDSAGHGVMSEVVSTFCRREIFGYRFVAMSSVAMP